MRHAVLEREELLEIPTSSLAYLGDAIYELYVRERLVLRHKGQSGPLFKESLCYVEQGRQAAGIEHIVPQLTEEEMALVKRSRNHVPASRPRKKDPAEYRKATALEALCAWLWFSGQDDRLEMLLLEIFEFLESEDAHE
jgi:ribonuclease-3 family protein